MTPRQSGAPEVSAGVVAYLQKGVAAVPRTEEAAVLAVAVETPPEALLAQVKAVVEENLSVTVDWSSLSLVDAGRAAAARTAQRHPELDAAALDALVWNFTFTWR